MPHLFGPVCECRANLQAGLPCTSIVFPHVWDFGRNVMTD